MRASALEIDHMLPVPSAWLSVPIYYCRHVLYSVRLGHGYRDSAPPVTLPGLQLDDYSPRYR